MTSKGGVAEGWWVHFVICIRSVFQVIWSGRGNLFISVALPALSDNWVVLCREPKAKQGPTHVTQVP